MIVELFGRRIRKSQNKIAALFILMCGAAGRFGEILIWFFAVRNSGVNDVSSLVNKMSFRHLTGFQIEYLLSTEFLK